MQRKFLGKRQEVIGTKKHLHYYPERCYINKVAAETVTTQTSNRTLKTEQRVNVQLDSRVTALTKSTDVLVETIMVETKQSIRENRNNASIEMSRRSF